MKSIIDIIITMLFVAFCAVVGFYCWPLLVGYASYRITKHYLTRYLNARRAKRAMRRTPRVLLLR